MFKVLFKLLAVFGTIFAALVGYSYWKKQSSQDYIEVYSDDDDDEF